MNYEIRSPLSWTLCNDRGRLRIAFPMEGDTQLATLDMKAADGTEIFKTGELPKGHAIILTADMSKDEIIAILVAVLFRSARHEAENALVLEKSC